VTADLPCVIAPRLACALLAAAAALAVACAGDPSSAAGVPGIFTTERAGGRPIWRGVWYVPTSNLYDLRLDAPPHAVWKIDGFVAGARLDDTPAQPRTVWLTRGFHDVVVETSADAPVPDLLVAPTGEALQPLGDQRVFAATPRPASLAGWLERARRIAARALPVALGISLVVGLAAILERWPIRAGLSAQQPRWRRVAAAAALPALVIAIAAILRLDAITQTYGPVSAPRLLRAVQEGVHRPAARLLPASIAWEPAPDWPHRDGPPTKYGSDPYTYLRFAREMTSFYAAHYREPLFPAVTRVWLWALADQDVAVSFASATFSVLTVAATFLLGAVVWSRGVGAAAAAALAIEYDVITWSTGGWRDDAFACAVVVSAYGLIRLQRSGAVADAVILGVAGGLACLVRITAVSFLLPGMFAVLLSLRQPWRRRMRALGIASAAALVMAGPYVVNCWRQFGDPLYAINYHTTNYLAAEGQPVEETSAASYVGVRLATRPWRTIDTLAIGMTAYPFANKWAGFDRWMPGLGVWIAALALGGMIGWLTTPAGRLLLVVLASSLVPFALTWHLAADWRFTAHAYPFFLIAAASALAAIVRAAAPATLRSLPSRWRAVPARAAGLAAATAVAVAAVAATVWRLLPPLVVGEALAAGEDITVPASGRTSVLFGSDWSPPYGAGAVVSRAALASPADIWLPLPRAQDYVLAIRLDPFPRPLPGSTAPMPAVRARVNGEAVADLQLLWNPDRVGSYEVRVSGSIVQPGLNRLTLDVQSASADVPSIAVWYVRIRQPAPMPAEAAGSGAILR
jgi:hypothetical protein